MKLLKKTSRTYLFISAFAFIAAGVIIYFMISVFLEGQLEENLLSDRTSVIKTLRISNSIPSFYPFIEVKEVNRVPVKKVESKDTLIYDESEKESIPYKQISSVDSINGKLYSIIVKETLVEKSDMLMSIGVAMGIVFAAVIISLFFIHRKLSQRIWNPFYRTLEDLRSFSYHDHIFNISSSSDIEEFAELNKTLEELTARVTSDYHSLKRFTEDASHEIQTPLSVIQLKLESLLQSTGLSKTQVDLISAAYISMQKLSKLTYALLLLTKIANGQFPEKTSVNISLFADQRIKSLDDQILSKKLILKTYIEPERTVEANNFLTDSVISNLIGNAVRYTSEGGEISILVSKNKFEVRNSGTPFSVSSSVIFQRFFKSGINKESTGLGLSIVKEICTFYNWEVTYEYKDEMHVFVVEF